MKNLLYIITLSDVGGAQNVVYQLINGLQKDYKIYLACAPGGELINWLSNSGTNVSIITLPGMKRSISILDDIFTLFQVIRIIKENHIDIVHCHSSKAGLIGRLAAWITRVPIRVFTVHGWSSYSAESKIVKMLYDLSERLAAHISTHIVCVSEADRVYALKHRLASKEKLLTIHNGVSPFEKKAHLRKELGIGNDKIIIGTAARLSRQKNPLFSIEVYSSLLIDNENLVFVWIGDGPLKAKCLEAVHDKGLDGRFILLGNRDDAINLIGDFDIFSLLSSWESLPMSIIEAMFCGLPVVATNVGGVGELVQDGVTGLLINDTNIEAIKKRVSVLIADNTLRRRYGEHAKILAGEKFNYNRMVEGYRNIYRG